MLVHSEPQPWPPLTGPPPELPPVLGAAGAAGFGVVCCGAVYCGTDGAVYCGAAGAVYVGVYDCCGAVYEKESGISEAMVKTGTNSQSRHTLYSGTGNWKYNNHI